MALERKLAGDLTSRDLAVVSRPGASWPGGFSVRMIGSVIVVPIAEELAFRGYLTRWLISREVHDVPLGRFSWWSFLVSSACFRLASWPMVGGRDRGHGLRGARSMRRGRLSDAVLAHAVTNGLIAAVVLGTGAGPSGSESSAQQVPARPPASGMRPVVLLRPVIRSLT